MGSLAENAIIPGAQVEVVPSAGPPNPWIDQKRGWTGVVMHALDELAGHVRVRFDPHGPRVMPVAALRLSAALSNYVAKHETLVIPPDAPRVRVRDNAGASSGEEHIVRRRGQVGHVIGECEIAAGFRRVVFAGSEMAVMIHKRDLVPVSAKPVVRTLVRQLGLPL